MFQVGVRVYQPHRGAAAWKVTNVDGVNTSVLCVAVDDIGDVVIGTAMVTTTTAG